MAAPKVLVPGLDTGRASGLARNEDNAMLPVPHAPSGGSKSARSRTTDNHRQLRQGSQTTRGFDKSGTFSSAASPDIGDIPAAEELLALRRLNWSLQEEVSKIQQTPRENLRTAHEIEVKQADVMHRRMEFSEVKTAAQGRTRQLLMLVSQLEVEGGTVPMGVRLCLDSRHEGWTLEQAERILGPEEPMLPPPDDSSILSHLEAVQQHHDRVQMDVMKEVTQSRVLEQMQRRIWDEMVCMDMEYKTACDTILEIKRKQGVAKLDTSQVRYDVKQQREHIEEFYHQLEDLQETRMELREEQEGQKEYTDALIEDIRESDDRRTQIVVEMQDAELNSTSNKLALQNAGRVERVRNKSMISAAEAFSEKVRNGFERIREVESMEVGTDINKLFRRVVYVVYSHQIVVNNRNELEKRKQKLQGDLKQLIVDMEQVRHHGFSTLSLRSMDELDDQIIAAKHVEDDKAEQWAEIKKLLAPLTFSFQQFRIILDKIKVDKEPPNPPPTKRQISSKEKESAEVASEGANDTAHADSSNDNWLALEDQLAIIDAKVSQVMVQVAATRIAEASKNNKTATPPKPPSSGAPARGAPHHPHRNVFAAVSHHVHSGGVLSRLAGSSSHNTHKPEQA